MVATTISTTIILPHNGGKVIRLASVGRLSYNITELPDDGGRGLWIEAYVYNEDRFYGHASSLMTVLNEQGSYILNPTNYSGRGLDVYLLIMNLRSDQAITVEYVYFNEELSDEEIDWDNVSWPINAMMTVFIVISGVVLVAFLQGS